MRGFLNFLFFSVLPYAKATILSKRTIFYVCVVPFLFCLESFFGKLNYLIAPEMVRWLQKNPRTNLEARGPIWRYLVMKWVSNISKKHENRLTRCHVRPNPGQSSRESHRMVHAMPPDTPRPPKFHLKYGKNMFLWKSRFLNFSEVFA